MNARTPRLEEVASLAGVSTATVSRFLNNPAMVAQQTATGAGCHR
jgi:LacI family gluconate utilization system Gnt-I transcriptional repressor